MRKYSVLTLLISGYTVLMALWLLSRALVFDQFWPLALLNTVAEYLFLPIPFLVIFGLWQHQRAPLLLLILPIAAFVGLWGNLFYPSLTQAPQLIQNKAFITVMNFNVLSGNQEYDAIVDSIHAASPDLIGFEELTPSSAEAIAQMLKTEYPYGTLQSMEDGRSAGLLSRFPIETSEWFSLPPRNISLHTVITIEKRRAHVFIVHLSPNNFFSYPLAEFVPLVIERYKSRATEVSRLEAEVGALNEPVLLVCDCNMTDTSETYTHLSSFLSDSFHEAG
jgi:endonuclease/exonuclease/phosphatase (EEP) superfamily protein YafD